MARFVRSCVVVVVVLLVARRAAAQSREWSDNTGRFRIQAELVEVAEDGVTLRRTDGSTVKVPLDRLSEADQRHIRERGARPVPRQAANNPEDRLLESIVRVGFTFKTSNGEEGGAQVLGIAIQTAESNPIVISNRLALPNIIPPESLDYTLSTATISELRGPQELGKVIGLGFPTVDATLQLGGGESVIVFRTSPETKIPMLTLSDVAPSASDVLRTPRLPPPNYSNVKRTNLPRIDWKPCSLLEGGKPELLFQATLKDGEAPSTQVLPVINAKDEVVGITGAAFAVVADKRKALQAVGIEEIGVALDRSKIKLPPLGGRSNISAESESARPIEAESPWRNGFEDLIRSIKTEKLGDREWKFDWGSAADFGAWYELANEVAIAYSDLRKFSTGSSERRALERRIEGLEADAARASKKLEGVVWTAKIRDARGANANSLVQFELPASPAPLHFIFKIEKDDVPKWARVKNGDKVQFAARFEANGLTAYPLIEVYMTLKEIVSQ
jgi:hypothetical protein